MRYLLDTHILLWAATSPDRLSSKAHAVIQNTENELLFSVASLWEIVIKSSLGRDDFHVEASLFRRALLENGYKELPILGEHTTTLSALPLLHKDPFDRLLIAQAIVEGVILLTADQQVVQYNGPIQLV